jgi:hypothetical protein
VHKRADRDASELAYLKHESERLVDADRRFEALHTEAAAAGEAADAAGADAEWAGAQFEACRQEVCDAQAHGCAAVQDARAEGAAAVPVAVAGADA